MNYETASDFEINKAVAEILGLQIWPIQSASIKIMPYSVVVDLWSKSKSSSMPVEKNYCNNPSDAWPIIVENKILIIPKSPDKIGDSVARNYDGSCRSYCKTPADLLRAAMIVFLKMNEAES